MSRILIAGGNCHRRSFGDFVSHHWLTAAPEVSLRLWCQGRAVEVPTLVTQGDLKMRREWAFLAGLGVGAVATLMLAPQSGKDTQELLAGKLKGGLDQVASAGKKVRVQVRDLANRGKANVAEAIDAGKEAYEQSRAAG